jgi:hypothetical protein
MRYLILILAITSGLSFAACGKSGSDTIAQPPPMGVGPVGVNANPGNCQIGQVHTPQYGCLNRNSCNYGFGWLAGEARCVQGTPITEQTVYGGAYQSRFYGAMSVFNQQQFQLLMKYANLCDPYSVGWNWGSYSCSSWTQRGGFIELRTFGSGTQTNANMFVGAGQAWAGQMTQWSYTYQMSANSPFIGFSQQARVTDFNNSAGMQIIGISFNGQDVGLRLIVNQGRLTDGSIMADVVYQNVKFATVNLQRY